MTKFTKQKKITKLHARILSKAHAHLQDLGRGGGGEGGKHVQSFKTISIKLYEELCLRGTLCRG